MFIKYIFNDCFKIFPVRLTDFILCCIFKWTYIFNILCIEIFLAFNFEASPFGHIFRSCLQHCTLHVADQLGFCKTLLNVFHENIPRTLLVIVTHSVPKRYFNVFYNVNKNSWAYFIDLRSLRDKKFRPCRTFCLGAV